MDHIHNQKITSRRDLHLNTDANARPVHNLALDPVHVTGNFLGPAPEPIKLLVNEFSNGGAAVSILCLLDQKLKGG